MVWVKVSFMKVLTPVNLANLDLALLSSVHQTDFYKVCDQFLFCKLLHGPSEPVNQSLIYLFCIKQTSVVTTNKRR